MYVRGPFSTGPKILQISSSRSGASYPHDGKGKKFFTYHKFRTGAVATTEQQTAGSRPYALATTDVKPTKPKSI